MPRLFLKLFGTFWLTTVLILSISIFVSFRIADEMSERLIDPREADVSLREVVESGGLAGLRRWVADSDNFLPGQTVYIVDSAGNELLGRDVPEYLERRLNRMWTMLERDADDDNDGNSDRRRPRDSDRRSRVLTPVLEMADGSRWLAMPGPTAPPPFGILSYGGLRWLVLGLAAVTSLVTFWLLSLSLSRPARRIVNAVDRFAAGDMSARVGSAASSNDEIGEIGRQFDNMAAELEAQSEVRRELFRNISHELRAPLARLQIATELLERKPAHAAEQLQRIRGEIEVLDGLTAQVLSLARASQHEGNDATVSLADVIERVSDNAQLEAGDKGIDLDSPLPDADITVRADETLLTSAIENVVRNAIQATPAGGRVSIAVTTEGDRCSVTVTDTGPGVPEDQLERIFEPFYRLDTNRAGSGIGLAITSRVMEQIGGSVKSRNADGKGLVVTLTMPVLRDRH